MERIKKTIGMAVLALTIVGMFALGGCENSLEQITPAQADKVTSEMNLHPWMSGINQSNFGTHGQKLLSLEDYKQVLLEINFILQNSGMKLEDYQRFIGTGISESWFMNSSDEVGYPIDGDASVSRKFIQDLIKSRSARHIMHTYRTSSGTKTVRVHKNVNSEWRTAVTQAVSAWNALGYGVQFVITYTNDVSDLYNVTGEIDVKLQNTDTNGNVFSSLTYAMTEYPSGDNKIGEAMHINSTHTNPGASAKKMVIAHELGHAIGMKHTDAYNGFGLDVPVQGCGDGTTDPTSLMRDGSTFMYDGIPWQGFSTCDKKVIDWYWGNIA